MMRSKSLIGISILVAAAMAGTAAWYSYTYQQFDISTSASRTVVSNFDVPNAQLAVTQIGSINRYEVTIPSQASLSSGMCLVQLTFGNPSNGSISRVAYGTFGSQARIGGLAPLNGTGGVVLDAQTSTQVASASASFGTSSLILDVDTSALAGASLLHAEVYATDTPPNIGANDIPDWMDQPSKALADSFPAGGIIMPTIPGA